LILDAFGVVRNTFFNPNKQCVFNLQHGYANPKFQLNEIQKDQFFEANKILKIEVYSGK